VKHLRHLLLCLLLVLSLASTALAAETPASMQFENLNGQQRAVLTYTLAPDIDPDTLIEDSIEYDGFRYTWAYTTKEEHPYQEVKTVTQTVTVETAKKDLSVILAELAPTIAYDDGGYIGTLALDHTTLSTKAAGYANRSSTVTETKVIGGLDRNDMSYIPATTVKNGKTLSLSNVEWQIMGTALVGEVLVPCQYQAVATYSGSSSYQVATGYVTTADYVGEVVSSGIKDVTYTVVYTGTEIIPPAPESQPSGAGSFLHGNPLRLTLFAIGLLLIVLLVLLALRARQKNVNIFIPAEDSNDYKLIDRQKIKAEPPTVDLRRLNLSAGDTVAIEIKRRILKKLVGMTVCVLCPCGEYSYVLESGQKDDWHEFQLPDDEDAAPDTEEVLK
jgi:hypothetical protein